MGIHSFLIFDRKGKTLFAKRYAKADPDAVTDEEQLEEQRKLVFGMLFSLREVVASLSPSEDPALHSVQTGASTIHNYETNSGLRVACYMNSSSSTAEGASIRAALEYIYTELWVQCVVRSPLYRPTEPNIPATNFEQKLDDYLVSQPWFR
jgi:archaeosine-15-forming tRNA-guanine transglycosylase